MDDPLRCAAGLEETSADYQSLKRELAGSIKKLRSRHCFDLPWHPLPDLFYVFTLWLYIGVIFRIADLCKFETSFMRIQPVRQTGDGRLVVEKIPYRWFGTRYKRLQGTQPHKNRSQNLDRDLHLPSFTDILPFKLFLQGGVDKACDIAVFMSSLVIVMVLSFF